MFGFERERERQRYYLLAGMGGRSARRKHKWMMQWAFFTGLIASIILGLALYFIHMYWR
jgi:hypothetical protein